LEGFFVTPDATNSILSGYIAYNGINGTTIPTDYNVILEKTIGIHNKGLVSDMAYEYSKTEIFSIPYNSSDFNFDLLIDNDRKYKMIHVIDLYLLDQNNNKMSETYSNVYTVNHLDCIAPIHKPTQTDSAISST